VQIPRVHMLAGHLQLLTAVLRAYIYIIFYVTEARNARIFRGGAPAEKPKDERTNGAANDDGEMAITPKFMVYIRVAICIIYVDTHIKRM
jgi:hypothetical protein